MPGLEGRHISGVAVAALEEFAGRLTQARSALWRSIFASVLGLAVRSGADGAGTGLGSAFLAALGAGDVASIEDIRTWAQPGDEVPPDPADHRRYDELYSVYVGLYAKLQPDFHVLSRQRVAASRL